MLSFHHKYIAYSFVAAYAGPLLIGNVVYGILSTFSPSDTSPASESSSCLEPAMEKFAYVNLAAEDVAQFIQQSLAKP